MSGSRTGSLFSGYSGLEMAVNAVYGATTAWHSDIDKGACKILAHRYPDVPNIGDITKVDWSQVEPVDILTGGSPCQDLSHAGKRQGMTGNTRSNLWVAMREAIAQLRPATVVWENVRGAYSAEAASELEFCPGCMGADRFSRGPVLRALGRVLGDLSDLGYDASWHGLRAADVGAPHGRFRVFVVATDTQRGGLNGGAPLQRRAPDNPARGCEGHRAPADPADLGHERARRARDGRTGSADGDSGTLTLLPTPAVNDMGEGKTVDAWDAWTAKMKAAHGNGNGHGASLAIEAQRLLPTPTVQHSARNSTAGRSPDARPHADGDTLANLVYDGGRWGDYAPAIARWEASTGRPAPAPTMTSTKGNPQLSPRFVEWLMGLPAGWITDVPGVTRNEALKALGNGVVRQQAAEALRVMATWERVTA